MLAINTLAKPSFTIAFAPVIGVYYIALFIRNRNKDTFKHCLSMLRALLPTMFILIWQYFIVYHEAEGGIEINPFFVYSNWGISVIIGLACGLLFPLCALMFVGFKKLKTDKMLLWGWMVTMVAWLQFAIFVASGARRAHCNLMWGYLLCQTIVFLVSIIAFIRHRRETAGLPQTTWDRIKLNSCYIAFTLHLCMGVLYYIHIYNGNGYASMFL